jgi:hypothetical protein
MNEAVKKSWVEKLPVLIGLFFQTIVLALTFAYHSGVIKEKLAGISQRVDRIEKFIDEHFRGQHKK